MRAFLFIAAFLVATLLPAAFGMAAQEKVSTVSRAMLNKIFSEEFSVAETEANLRVELEGGGPSPVRKGYFVSWDFGEGRPCQEQNILQLSSMRLNTCINLVDDNSKEKGFVIYGQREGNQIFGRYQSFADSACTKKRGWPRKMKFQTDTCMDGTKVEISEDLDFSTNENHGVVQAIYSKPDACTNNRYNNILIAVATPHNLCQESDENDPDQKTTACGAQVAVTSYASSDGTCTGSASPSTRPLLDCEQVPGPAGNVWISEYCL